MEVLKIADYYLTKENMFLSMSSCSLIKEVDLLKDFKALVFLFEKCDAYFFSQHSKILKLKTFSLMQNIFKMQQLISQFKI